MKISQDKPKKTTHVEHVRAEVEKASPGHQAGEASFNDLRQEQLLGEKPAPNVAINPANGLA